jgi:hypothetical protein
MRSIVDEKAREILSGMKAVASDGIRMRQPPNIIPAKRNTTVWFAEVWKNIDTVQSIWI